MTVKYHQQQRSKYLQTTIIASNSCKALNKQANIESELATKIAIKLFGDKKNVQVCAINAANLGFIGHW